MGGKVIIITNKSEWTSHQTRSKNESKALLVDFTATWCGPCRMIAPFFEELSLTHDNVLFLKVDVDAVEEVASDCSITAMPTFQVWKGTEKVEELVGASKERLQALAQKYNA